MCPNSHFRIDATGAVCESCRPGQYHSAVLKRCKKNSILASSVAALEAYAHWFRGVHDKVNCFIAPSQFMTDRLLAHGWPPERVPHVPYCLEMETGHRRTDEGNYFLFVGKLEALKGIHVLLDAAAKAPSAEILLVGSCDDEDVRARSCERPGECALSGNEEPDEVRRLMAGARAVLSAFDLVRQPALCHFGVVYGRRPVIGTRIGGIPELVADGERGLLVEPGSADRTGGSDGVQLEKEPAPVDRHGYGRTKLRRCDIILRGAHLASISDIYQRAIRTGQQPALMDAVRSNPQMDLTVITTYRCDSKCAMCHIWQHPTQLRDEVTLETLAKLPGGFDNLNITGGEPTLRRDLAEIVALLYPKARTLEISSNGLHADRLEPIIKAYPNIKVRFSLEAVGEKSDEIRGEKDGFKKKVAGLRRLKELGATDVGLRRGHPGRQRSGDGRPVSLRAE